MASSSQDGEVRAQISPPIQRMWLSYGKAPLWPPLDIFNLFKFCSSLTFLGVDSKYVIFLRCWNSNLIYGLQCSKSRFSYIQSQSGHHWKELVPPYIPILGVKSQSFPGGKLVNSPEAWRLSPPARITPFWRASRVPWRMTTQRCGAFTRCQGGVVGEPLVLELQGSNFLNDSRIQDGVLFHGYVSFSGR